MLESSEADAEMIKHELGRACAALRPENLLGRFS
jgi:hypothetical protein